MKSKNRSGWSVPLMEIMIAVGFFIVCGAVCVQVFARTEVLSRRSEDTGHSILVAQTIAEAVKASGKEAFTEILDAEDAGDGSYVMRWNKNWEPVKSEEIFRAEIQTREENRMLQANIVLKRGKETLYELSVSRYLDALPESRTGG